MPRKGEGSMGEKESEILPRSGYTESAQGFSPGFRCREERPESGPTVVHEGRSPVDADRFTPISDARFRPTAR